MPTTKPNRNAESNPRRGISLAEILIVVAVVGVVALAAVPLFQPNLVSQLDNAADVVLADAARARNLAVANNSKYKLVFNADHTGYYLQHSGSSSSLNSLPSWPYRQSSDPATRHTTLLASMPGLGDVQVSGVVQIVGTTRTQITEIEFDSLGSTTNVNTTEIWLVAGNRADRRYISITINPTTGLASVGSIAGEVPSAAVPTNE